MTDIQDQAPQAVLYLLSGDGSAVRADISELNELIASDKMLWLVAPFDIARDILKNIPGVSPIALHSLCVRDSRPRALLLSDESLLLNIRTVNTGDNPEDMISIRVWMNARMLVSVYRTEAKAIKNIEKNLLMGEGPKTLDSFLLQLLERTLDHISEVTCALDKEVDDVEYKIAKQTWKITRGQLSELRHRVMQLRRYLVPERDAIGRLQAIKIEWISELNLVRLREVNNEVLRLLEDVDSAKERTTMLYEELFNIGQEKINQKIFILSMVTLIFMPITFLSGLFGVNVGGLPLLHDAYGFLTLCGLMIIVFIIEVFVLRKLKWL